MIRVFAFVLVMHLRILLDHCHRIVTMGAF